MKQFSLKILPFALLVGFCIGPSAFAAGYEFRVAAKGISAAPSPSVPADSHNYATWNPADKGSAWVLSNGNLTAVTPTASVGTIRATKGLSTGKWYWEFKATGPYQLIGVANTSMSLETYIGAAPGGWAYYNSNGAKYSSGYTAYGQTWSTADVIGVALDMDAGSLTFYKNNVSQGVAFTGLNGTLYPAMSGAGDVGDGGTVNFGATPFVYTPPAGYNAGVW